MTAFTGGADSARCRHGPAPVPGEKGFCQGVGVFGPGVLGVREQEREVEVAVEGKCERAGDGCRRHGKQVRGDVVLLRKLLAVCLTEAVLLVDDGVGQVLELE